MIYLSTSLFYGYPYQLCEWYPYQMCGDPIIKFWVPAFSATSENVKWYCRSRQVIMTMSLKHAECNVENSGIFTFLDWIDEKKLVYDKHVITILVVIWSDALYHISWMSPHSMLNISHDTCTLVWKHQPDVIQCIRSSYHSNNVYLQYTAKKIRCHHIWTRLCPYTRNTFLCFQQNNEYNQSTIKIIRMSYISMVSFRKCHSM